jgi:hypothetical protein
VGVTARFTNTGSFTPPLSGAVVRAARAIVRSAVFGWTVGLRFHASSAGLAHMRVFRNGRSMLAFQFAIRGGNIAVGPFRLGAAGRYTFRLVLNATSGRRAQVTWRVCLPGGSCL